MPELQLEYPYLHLTVRDGQTVLAGDLPLVLDGAVIDQFQIEVIVLGGGPRIAIPIVRETGGRIPRISDRHVDADGAACLFVRDEYWFRHPSGMTISEFLRGPVTSYFVAQHSFEAGCGWPYGERAHGDEGVVEFYGSLFDTRDVDIVRRLLELVTLKNIHGRWRCPCGSGRRINSCHGTAIRDLRSRVPREVALASLAALIAEATRLRNQEIPL